VTALTWIRLPDLLAHELVASAHEGKDVVAIQERWRAAGGAVDAPAGGRGPSGDAGLTAQAARLLDELAALQGDPALVVREPTYLADIEALAPAFRTEEFRVGVGASASAPTTTRQSGGALSNRVRGAWVGRAAGCLLGKPVEKVPREGIREILQSQGRWPLDAWFTAKDLPDHVADRWPWNRRSATTSLAENIVGMPEDDDLNFALVALSVLERNGPRFTSNDVADEWLASLSAGRVFTAERVAYRNLLLGLDPPATATYRNPYREWIGAQIRSDVYGWVNPGDPAAAARMAWQDAVVSHVRSGVYGAMCVAAMCATAVVARDIDEVVEAGLSVVPPDSRYAAAFRRGIELGRAGRDDDAGDEDDEDGDGGETAVTADAEADADAADAADAQADAANTDADPDTAGLEAGLDAVHADYGQLHWVHALNNACLVAYALTRSRGDFADAICTVVMGGWDTDSNGATVGSICGALTGAAALPPPWVTPLRNRLASSLPGFDGIGFDTLTERTLAVMRS
jgi:ADP-ribosylglycohydrolase